MNASLTRRVVIGAARRLYLPSLCGPRLLKPRADTGRLATSGEWRCKRHVTAHSIPKTQFPPVVEVGVLIEGFGRGAKRRRRRRKTAEPSKIPNKGIVRHVDHLALKFAYNDLCTYVSSAWSRFQELLANECYKSCVVPLYFKVSRVALLVVDSGLPSDFVQRQRARLNGRPNRS
jgi:hypothetical protein